MIFIVITCWADVTCTKITMCKRIRHSVHQIVIPYCQRPSARSKPRYSYLHPKTKVVRGQIPPTEDGSASFRMPAIYLSCVTDFSVFRNKSIPLTGVINCSRKSFLMIDSDGLPTFTITVEFLKDAGARFHTFRLHALRRVTE